MPLASGTQSPRRTRGAVHWQDRAAGIVITVGGIGVIAAVLAIGVYLAMVALPLFSGAKVKSPREASVRGVDGSSGAAIGVPLAMFVDDYGLGAFVIDAGGVARWIAVETGEVAGSAPVALAEKKASAWVENAEGSLLAIGYEDGTIQFGSVEFETSLLAAADVPESARGLSVGRSRAWADAKGGTSGRLGGVVARLNEREWRVVRPVVKLSVPVALTHGSGRVERLAYAKPGDAELVVALRADGSMALDRVTTTRPLGGGAPRVQLQSTAIAAALPVGSGLPEALYVTSDASDVLLLWSDGRCQRYANFRQDLESIPLAETMELLPAGRKLTASGMLLGGLSMLVGDDTGEVRAVFAAQRPDRGAVDGRSLLVGHTLESFGQRVTSLGISQRMRMVAIGDELGNVALRSVASDKDVADLVVAAASSGGDGGGGGEFKKVKAPTVLGAAFVRSEGVVALHADGVIRSWHLDPGHPEVSVRSMFAKVHYEGQPVAEHTYQSSSASDSAEVKLGLMPLIHGTLKATLFAMLFAVPIAVGGAVYTSEFLHPTWRTRIKPAVEMMASLPSVVLGFVAAMVVAPLVRDVVPAFLAALVVVPMCVLIGAHLWQLAPGPVVARTGAVKRLSMVAACMAIGAMLASVLGPAVESRLFTASRSDKLVAAGFFETVPEKDWPAWVGRRDTMSPDDERHLRADGLYFRDRVVVRPVEPGGGGAGAEDEAKIRDAAAAQGIARGDLLRWLDGSIGGAWPGWFIVLIPLGLVGVWVARVSTPLRRLDRFLQQPTEFRGGVARLIALGASTLAALVLAGVGASVLTSMGLDPRDLMFGPFNQRNSLVVGIIMGFAIIPIIYTISEDAMSSVPGSLRTASLGAGATPWQTAVRVVLPVAASGIFSALMIGLGRAVGETMIVVMATGNTPSMDWSVFSGFRTLSANIAVELPEAPQHSTHYRVLFLCGLALFVMTFLVNTTAEVVRQRVRRRIASL